MKKYLISAIIMILLISSIGIIAQANQEDIFEKLREKIMFSDPIIKNNDNINEIELQESTSTLYIPGYYQLPVVTKVFKFPFGTKIISVNVEFDQYSEIELEKPIAISESPKMDIFKQNEITQIKIDNTQITGLESDKYSCSISTGKDGKDIVHFISIRMLPVQYKPSENKIYYSKEAEITINYKEPEKPTTFSDEYDLLIVAPDKFSTYLQPLVNHKIEKGLDTKLVTVSEINNEFYFPLQGRDCPEELKYFIKDAVENWGVDYVILVGGRFGGIDEEKWWLPVRYSHLDDGAEGRYITDLYFADLYDGEGNFSSWDTNENDIFGEWVGTNKDILDMYPDVFVGRLPCINTLEVKVMVDKIIEYENTAYGSDWFKRFVGVAGDTYPAVGDPYMEGELATEASFNLLDESFEASYIWTSTGTFSDAKDVVDEISKGCGFVHFSGHGSSFAWGNHPPESDEFIYGPNALEMYQFKNGGKQPITIVGGCHNAQYNTSFSNFIKGLLEYGLKYFSTEPPIGEFWRHKWIPRCWAWSMASRIRGGSIAIIANTGYGYGQSGEHCLEQLGRFLEINFFRSYSEGKDILGETHSQDLIYYMNEFPPMDNNIDCKIVQQWALLGDPSLKIGGYAE